ncbi:NIPSNAP family protein [Pseudomonas congelans]|uniref:NIPSNAP family protein n=1 Tax=Pseudomonas congelans TaxID=200452 RepID=UPI00165603FB|nr:NIPSNAP family protein [Pseudomonas congelans]MBC8802635.1 NIPSNAP family protein [Pseudomonas congelans]
MSFVEERCYVLHTEFGAKDYFEIYEQGARHLQQRILGGFLGYYTTEFGELNALVSLWKYDSIEERQARRAQLASEPEWLAFLAKVRPMIKTMNNRLLSPAAFTEPQVLACK